MTPTPQRLRCIRLDTPNGKPSNPMFTAGKLYEAFVGERTTCVIDDLGHQRVMTNDGMRFDSAYFMLEDDTPLAEIREQTITVTVINYEAIQQEVNRYLQRMPICGVRYTCNNVTAAGVGKAEIHLVDVESGEEPDEDFQSDDAFDALCARLAARLPLTSVDVPYWYYGK